MEKLQNLFLILVACLAPFIVVMAWKQGPEAPIAQNNSDMEYRDLGFHKFAYNLVESAMPADNIIVENNVQPGTRTDTRSVFTRGESTNRVLASANSYRIDNQSNRVISKESALYDQYQGELIKEGNRRYGSRIAYSNNYRYSNTASAVNTGVQLRGFWIIFVLAMMAVIVFLTRINYRKRARVIHHYRY